jgi:sRNA-binding protein
VRVVNERAQLDEQKREFQRQRNADIMRMREEAEHLERCLQQVEQSHQALERTRKELEEKHRDLDDLHAQLVQHETNYWRSNQGIP